MTIPPQEGGKACGTGLWRRLKVTPPECGLQAINNYTPSTPEGASQPARFFSNDLPHLPNGSRDRRTSARHRRTPWYACQPLANLRRVTMRAMGSMGLIAIGLAVGMAAAVVYLGQSRPAVAASNDRYKDYIMATGAVSVNPRVQTDG